MKIWWCQVWFSVERFVIKFWTILSEKTGGDCKKSFLMFTLEVCGIKAPSFWSSHWMKVDHHKFLITIHLLRLLSDRLMWIFGRCWFNRYSSNSIGRPLGDPPLSTKLPFLTRKSQRQMAFWGKCSISPLDIPFYGSENTQK